MEPKALRRLLMKMITLAATAFAIIMGPSLAVAEQNASANECGAAMLRVENGKVSVVEDGKTTEIDIRHKKSGKAQKAAAITRCKDLGDVTVCSNGRYGCVWSNRTGKLLGCGAGI